MKLLVDQLPNFPEECMMHTIKETCIHTCRLTDDLYFECKIGTEGFECPYLRRFKANAIEHFLSGNAKLSRTTPVELVPKVPETCDEYLAKL